MARPMTRFARLAVCAAFAASACALEASQAQGQTMAPDPSPEPRTSEIVAICGEALRRAQRDPRFLERAMADAEFTEAEKRQLRRECQVFAEGIREGLAQALAALDPRRR